MFINVYFCFNVLSEVFFSSCDYINSVILFVDFLSSDKFVYNYNYIIIKVVK
jgi:hypothetical protein